MKVYSFSHYGQTPIDIASNTLVEAKQILADEYAYAADFQLQAIDGKPLNKNVEQTQELYNIVGFLSATAKYDKDLPTWYRIKALEKLIGVFDNTNMMHWVEDWETELLKLKAK